MGNSSRKNAKNRCGNATVTEVEQAEQNEETPLELSLLGPNYDVNLLNSLLLQRGVSASTENTRGNTLLHYSVILNRLEVFHFLLNKKNIDLDEVNSDGHSALMLALIHEQPEYAVKLIRHGADINLVDKYGSTLLHYAILYSPSKFCNFLLEKGPNLNAQNEYGETALHLACHEYADVEKIYMLLYYGADASIPCDKGTIPLFLAIVNHPHSLNLHKILLNYTFEKGFAMDLKVLTNAVMFLNKPIFYDVLDRVNQVTYTTSDLELLNDWLPRIPAKLFKIFFEKFDFVIRDLFSRFCTLTNYLLANESLKQVSPDFLEVLEFLLASHLAFEAVQSCCSSISAISSLVKIFHKNKLPLIKLTKLVCIMLSYGVRVTSSDLNAVYVFYGRCELFNILVYMDIEKTETGSRKCCSVFDYEVVQESIMAHLIYDIDLTIDRFLEKPQWYLAMDLDVLLDYFAVPKLKEFFLLDCFTGHIVQEKVMKMPTVPYLTELARNATRIYIIDRIKVKNARQFYTVVKWLPIAEEHKKILCYEKKLYYV